MGKKLGALLKQGDCLAFKGGLGAGKTCFIRGLAAGLGVEDVITSPTYTIANEYEGSLPFYHIDAYRLASADDFEMLDAAYYLDGNAVCAIEWSENIAEALPSDRIIVSIAVLDDNTRRVDIEAGELERMLR